MHTKKISFEKHQLDADCELTKSNYFILTEQPPQEEVDNVCKVQIVVWQAKPLAPRPPCEGLAHQTNLDYTVFHTHTHTHTHTHAHTHYLSLYYYRLRKPCIIYYVAIGNLQPTSAIVLVNHVKIITYYIYI